MELFDTHAHLDEDAFAPDLETVVEAAAAGGVTRILAVGTTAASSRTGIELAARFPGVYAAVGIHPNYAAQAAAGDWEIIEEIASFRKVVAIGETGLDRHWDHTPFDVQRDHFSRHINLAKRLDLPFVVHCRDAEPDVLSMLRQAATGGPLKGIMHSFCGSSETAAECLALGLHVSFSGMITYKKNADLRALAATIPADRLLVETDCPYLAPAKRRGKRNEPGWVAETAECLAEVRGMTPDALAALTTANARRLFGV